jgi:archaellum biogenesis protein FlaJ (TadC family)
MEGENKTAHRNSTKKKSGILKAAVTIFIVWICGIVGLLLIFVSQISCLFPFAFLFAGTAISCAVVLCYLAAYESGYESRVKKAANANREFVQSLNGHDLTEVWKTRLQRLSD